jgi:hypothetical protein
VTWWAALVARWRLRRLAREARRRRELVAASCGHVSTRWIQTHYYTSGQGRDD